MRIADWLNAVGLAEYIAAFETNHIDLDQLNDLTDADLKEIGVLALGHRRSLLKAAKERSLILPPLSERREYPSFSSERRHLTILFLDIVDSTALATVVDPEDLSDTIGRFQKAAIAQINSFEGYVARSFGDGLLAYFGWPKAHEDDPQRAILAADATHRAISDLRRPDGRPLFARAGVATGWVVLGDIGGAVKDEVVGETPNLAARLQSVAAPGQTVIASSTAALLGDEFALQDLGPQTLKGFDSNPRAYAVTSIKQRARFQSRAIRTTPLVGRASEITLLRDLWSKAKSGRGQTLILTGEAGIGKTRVIRELLDQIRSDRQVTMRYHCSPYYQNSALRPMIVQLSEAAGILPEDNAADRLNKLRELLRVTNASDDAVSLIAELLSIPASDQLIPLQLTPIQKRQRTFHALAEQFRDLANGATVLAIVEDAHWIDPTTAEYLDLIVRSVDEVAALVIVSGRLEYSPPSSWQQLPSSNYFLLKALSDDNSRALAERVAGASLPAWVTAAIASRTDGVPLFVEELTKGLVEGGLLKYDGHSYELTDPPLQLAIPSTLQDSLTARLDNLPGSKSIAQIGAALGREFRLDHLAAITGLPVSSIKEQVNGLESAGLVFGRRAPLDGTYVFKHALVQSASYESLLLSKRKSLHGQIAEILTAQFPEVCENEPEVVAAHWSRSNSPSKSTAFWLRAGQNALKRSAYLEALNNLRHGSEFLSSGTAENGRIEFDLNLCTGQASYVINGPAAEQTTKAYSRALELIELVDQPDQRFDLLYGIFSGYHFASKFDLAREPAEKMYEIATKMNDDGHICQAHRMLGYLNFFEGKLLAAIGNFEALALLYRPELHAPMATRYGADSLVAARGFEAVAHGVCGHLDRAQRLADENVAYARQLNHPPSLGWAFAAGGYLNYFLDKPEAALKYVEEGARYCEVNNVAVWGIHCRLFEVWVKSASSTNADSSIEVMRKGIANANSRISLGVPLFRAALADLLLTTEQIESAIQEIDIALSELRSTGQRFFAPTVYYVKGSCSRKLGGAHADDSATWYERSALAAREMQAKLLESRALGALAQG